MSSGADTGRTYRTWTGCSAECLTTTRSTPTPLPASPTARHTRWSLGITNGDVFDSVIAFSPGFSAAEARTGRPRFFVSHGTQDPVLPIDQCSRRLVPALEEHGYDVTYREFTGGHEVPPHIMDSAVDGCQVSDGPGGPSADVPPRRRSSPEASSLLREGLGARAGSSGG
jgi:acetyl esterase/lipase